MSSRKFAALASCADRISASMISTARSFCSRLTSPATRYQTLVARSWGSMRPHPIRLPAPRQRLREDTGLLMAKFNQQPWPLVAGAAVIPLAVVPVAGCELSLIRGDWTKPGGTEEQWRKDA